MAAVYFETATAAVFCFKLYKETGWSAYQNLNPLKVKYYDIFKHFDSVTFYPEFYRSACKMGNGSGLMEPNYNLDMIMAGYVWT